MSKREIYRFPIRAARFALRPIVWAHRRKVKVSRQAGFALILVTVTLAVIGAVVGEFGYNARVEYESATNARDQLRAEYLARSGVNLSRLLIKVQQVVLDRNRQFVGDVQIADFAPYLIGAFGGSEDERGALGGLLGIDASNIKGLGVGKDASFDVVMGSEDGKININCGGGQNFNSLAPVGLGAQQAGSTPAGNSSSPTQGLGMPITKPVQGLYAVLIALFYPPRYNRLFDNPDADGQYFTRDEVARAVIDWSDQDEQRYEPQLPGSNPEDYHYDTLRDAYKAHNHFFDTVDEMQLVRGVGDDLWGSFGEMLTVYGRCQVNLNAIKMDTGWPIAAAIIRAAAKDPNNPVLLDDVAVAALAQQIMSLAQMVGGVQSSSSFADMAKNGGMPTNLASLLPSGMGGGGASSPLGQAAQALLPSGSSSQLAGIELDPQKLKMLATTGPRAIYRLDSTGTVSRPGGRKIQVHVRGVWDTTHINQNTTSMDPNDRQGTWVYWRME